MTTTASRQVKRQSTFLQTVAQPQKYLPNAVSFGPGMPGEKYMGHTANEFKKLSNLLLDTQMFSEMMLRIGNLETL